MDPIYPVILAVPAGFADLPRPEKQPWLSRYARRPLRLSAEESGLLLPETLPKNEKGRPLPFQGTWWSVSHKEEYVAGLAARSRIGIDVEKIKPLSPALVAKIVHPSEQALFPGDEASVFFRCWTAKEAVLKAEGGGLGDLFHCRIKSVINANRLTAAGNHDTWHVNQCFFNGHLAAVATKHRCACHWTIVNDMEEEVSSSKTIEIYLRKD